MLLTKSAFSRVEERVWAIHVCTKRPGDTSHAVKDSFLIRSNPRYFFLGPSVLPKPGGMTIRAAKLAFFDVSSSSSTWSPLKTTTTTTTSRPRMLNPALLPSERGVPSSTQNFSPWPAREWPTNLLPGRRPASSVRSERRSSPTTTTATKGSQLGSFYRIHLSVLPIYLSSSST